jgi:hypothetical protein
MRLRGMLCTKGRPVILKLGTCIINYPDRRSYLFWRPVHLLRYALHQLFGWHDDVSGWCIWCNRGL